MVQHDLLAGFDKCTLPWTSGATCPPSPCITWSHSPAHTFTRAPPGHPSLLLLNPWQSLSSSLSLSFCLFPASLWFFHFSKLPLHTLQRTGVFKALCEQQWPPFGLLGRSHTVLWPGPPRVHLECKLTWPPPRLPPEHVQSVDLRGRLHGFLSLGSGMGFHQERGGFSSSSRPLPSVYSRLSSVPALPFYLHYDSGQICI